jgi:hypothetical protein
LDRLNMARENMWHLAHSPTLAARLQLRRALDDGEPPGFIAAMTRVGSTEEDAWRIFYESLAGWMLFVFQVHNLAQMTAGERDAVNKNIRLSFGSGIGKLWYESHARNTADADVVRHVDALLAQPG